MSQARSVIVDGSDDDARTLTHYFAGRGAKVSIVCPEGTDPATLLASYDGLRDKIEVKGRDEIGNIAGADTLFVSLTTPGNDPLVVFGRENGLILSNLADTVLRQALGKKIGITGSAGKTTTTSLLTSILRAANRDVIGSTDFRLTPSGPGGEMLRAVASRGQSAWSVVELTSHHLDYVNNAPDIAIVTNLFADHQDWHGSFEAYRAAKQRLLRFQTASDVAILNYDDDEVRGQFAVVGAGRKIFFSMSDQIAEGVVVADGWICLRSGGDYHRICEVCSVKMPSHHLPNALAATSAAVALGVDHEILRQELTRFSGVAQRCQLRGSFGGIEFYDDTLALNPRKALTGLKTFPDRSLILVSGGAVIAPGGEKRVSSDLEKADLRAFCQAVVSKANTIVLFGEGGKAISEMLAETTSEGLDILTAETFESAVLKGLAAARECGRLLVSPVFYNPPLVLKGVLDDLTANFS